MGRGRRKPGRRSAAPPPLPIEPVDLLAGLAPGVELHADDLPPGIDPQAPSDGPLPATMTVAEAGRLIRRGEGTVRRLIRTTVVGAERRPDDVEADRAGVLPRTPDKPGE